MSDEREILTWEGFGVASRELAQMVADDDFEPDMVLSIARGGLLIGGAMGYALSVKNTYTMNVEFYTGVDERLALGELAQQCRESYVAVGHEREGREKVLAELPVGHPGFTFAVGGEGQGVDEHRPATVELDVVGAGVLQAHLVFEGELLHFERGQRRITVNYAKRQQGRKVYAAQSTHLPLKLNMAGVIPPIFASSIILFPATMGSWVGQGEGMGWLKDFSATLSPGQPLYVIFYALAIVFFCFFYTALVFNAKETADNLKKSGAFIPGIRPGEQTAKYIDGVMTRLTTAGAVYITLVCLLPEFMILYWNVPFYFGGTSLLIIVVVTMDFMAQVQTHLVSHQYSGLMKKANLKGHGGTGLLR